jgi:AcrR family transcriptional regulator
MTSSEPRETARPVVGLRERKKAKTRAAIRSQAIRMFAEQGYAATTVEQIAEAADISQSTFFRYFATKEMVIITDEYDQVILDAFLNQPADMHPIRAFRIAIKETMARIGGSPEEEEQERRRQALFQTVPELRSAMLDQYAQSLNDLARIIAERLGRPSSDFRIRTMAGAITGVAMSVSLDGWMSGPTPDDLAGLITRFDTAMELLELGLPL